MRKTKTMVRKGITTYFLIGIILLSLLMMTSTVVQSRYDLVFISNTITLEGDNSTSFSTPLVSNKREIVFYVTVESYSNTSMEFLQITNNTIDYNWTPSLNDSFTLVPGEAYEDTFELSIEGGEQMLIAYHVALTDTESNATFTYAYAKIPEDTGIFPSNGFTLTFISIVTLALVITTIRKKK